MTVRPRSAAFTVTVSDDVEVDVSLIDPCLLLVSETILHISIKDETEEGQHLRNQR